MDSTQPCVLTLLIPVSRAFCPDTKKAFKNNHASLTAGQDRGRGQEANILSCPGMERSGCREHGWLCLSKALCCSSLTQTSVSSVQSGHCAASVCTCAVWTSVHGLTGLLVSSGNSCFTACLFWSSLLTGQWQFKQGGTVVCSAPNCAVCSSYLSNYDSKQHLQSPDSEHQSMLSATQHLKAAWRAAANHMQVHL